MSLNILLLLAICTPALLKAEPVIPGGVLSSGHGVTVQNTGSVSTGLHHGPYGAGQVITSHGTKVINAGGSHMAGGIGAPMAAPIGVPLGVPLAGHGIYRPMFMAKTGLVGPVYPGTYGIPYGVPLAGTGAVKTSSVQTSQQMHHLGGAGVVGAPYGIPIGGVGGAGQTLTTKTISQQSNVAGHHAGVGTHLYG